MAPMLIIAALKMQVKLLKELIRGRRCCQTHKQYAGLSFSRSRYIEYRIDRVY